MSLSPDIIIETDRCKHRDKNALARSAQSQDTSKTTTKQTVIGMCIRNREAIRKLV